MNQPSVKKNYIYRLLYEILILLTPFVTTPYVSRVLGPDGNGIYSYTMSIMTYFTLFAALGTASYGAREIAQHRDDRKESSKIFWEIQIMTICTTLACLFVWCGFILFSKEYRFYFIALTPQLIGTMFDISWYFTGYEQVKYIVLRNSACKLAGVALLFLLVKDKNDLILYMVINTGVLLIGNLSMWTYLPRMLVKVDFKTLKIKRHFRETLVYFIPTIATSVYTILDKTLIGLMTGSNYQNGYYEQATKVINMAKSVVFVSVNSVMGARISYLFAEKKYDEIRQRINRSMNFILLLGYGCVFGIIGVASTFVPVFFGEGYEPVVGLLYLMAPLILIIGVSNCLGSHYYTPSGQRSRSAKFIITGSLVNLCMNLIFIPKLGAVGATIGSIIAEVTITILYVIKSDGYMSFSNLMKFSAKRLLAGIVMGVSIYGLGSLMQDFTSLRLLYIVGLQVMAGVSIYGIILLIIKDDMLYFLLGMVWGFVKKKVR